MSRCSGLMALLALSALLLSGNSWGEDKASREREALRRTQQQVQQIRQEKTALEEKLATAERDKASATTEKEGLQKEKDKYAGQLGAALKHAKEEGAKGQQAQLALEAVTQEKLALQTQKAALESRLAELNAKQDSTERDLAQAQALKTRMDATLQSRDQQIASCEDKNAKLYVHGRDLIEQCRDRSATDTMLRLDPFTGIKRVGIENLLEEYRDRLEAQKSRPADQSK